MGTTDWATKSPDEVLDYWFPQDGHWENPASHIAFWKHRMQGGVDEEICARFVPLATAAAQGLLDHWAQTPRGRLALVIALDQFPRSAWRDTPAAYAQDIKAANLCLEAMDNGDWAALPNVWEKQFMIIAIGHAEGPDHADRIRACIPRGIAMLDEAPPHLATFGLIGADQTLNTLSVITRFGRHPHRNEILGRTSTPQEEEYVAGGAFPHNRALPSDPAGIAQEIEAIKARLAPYQTG